MKQIPGGVTAAKGFQAASTAAKIKYQNRQDMALLYSEAPCALAGVFTTNLVKAAPVQWDKAVLDSKAPVHAVVINSGIANACTGVPPKRRPGPCKFQRSPSWWPPPG